MLSFAPFWLAGVAIIGLISLWARANRRTGWRRERPSADVPSVRELLELSEEVRRGAEQTSRTPVVPLGSPVSPPDPGSLVALEAALRHAAPARETQPQEPQKQTMDEGVEVP